MIVLFFNGGSHILKLLTEILTELVKKKLSNETLGQRTKSLAVACVGKTG